MATDTTRRSFKDKAKERLASFRLKGRPTLPELSKSSSREDESSASADSGVDMGSHGHLNPLSWDNLPQAIRDKLEGGSDTVNAQQETNGEKSDKKEDLPKKTMARPQPNIEYVNVTDPVSPKTETEEKTVKRRSRHVTQPRGTLQYMVKDRDTLTSMAAQFDTTPSEIKTLNKLITTCIFPGQVLFVPDKDFVPSPQPSPSPTEDKAAPGSAHGSLPGSNPPSQPVSQPGTPDIPLVRQVDPSRLPGHAERLMAAAASAASDFAGDNDSSDHPRPLSEDEAQKLDQECHERFIKVNVKHITDGQGVVSGVLLVTPNAIMFDPNVSDPLVIEHGADAYGMIAPMDTIISAAMYHDIAAMKLKGMTKEEQDAANQHSSEVYHAHDCPLYQRPVPISAGQPSAPEETKPPPQAQAPSTQPVPELQPPQAKSSEEEVKNKDFEHFRQDSACRCGADLMSPEESKAKFGTPVTEGEGTDHTDQGLTFTASQPGQLKRDMVDFSTTGIPPQESAASGATTQSVSENAALTHAGASDAHTGSELAGRGPDSEQFGGADAHSEMPKPSEISATNKSPDHVKPVEEVEGERRSLSASPQKQARKVSESDVGGQEKVPGEEGDDVFDNSVSPSVPVPGGSPGILGRAVGSITSLGSSIASNSPNFSSIVDFSSGLFTRNQDERGRVKDVNEVGIGTPPRGSWALNEDGEPKSLDEIESEGVIIDKPASVSEAPPPTPASTATEEPHKKPEVEVHSAVTFEEKAEMFKSLDELIPRPARQYDDPPLYLCLKVGVPIKKRMSQTCPIESYMKKRTKPEYWFSIPRDKVDHLYAFFIQWSPNIYGTEEQIDPKERGFVVINDSDDEDDIDVVEDHFKQERRLLRQMTKDWEVWAVYRRESGRTEKIVNLEEARRRMSLVEDEMIPIPEFSDPSTILEEEQVKKIIKSLPARAEGYPWTLAYSSDKHGFSLKTLYRFMSTIDSPILLLIKDTNNQVFGALLSGPPKLSDHFYGTGESFLFTFYPEYKKFAWTGQNSFFIKGNADCLAIGAGEGTFGLWLDGDIYHGRTKQCQTFDNDLLTETEDFVVKGLEAWAFI